MNPANLLWRIALVRPRNPLNIGAAARAMANFGFRNLVVVEPYDPVWQESRSAVGAGDVLRSARTAATLAEALSDVTLVVGTTSGQRRALDRELISLDQLRPWIQRQARHRKAALLFGSEKTGLSNENLSYCHVLVRIPTTRECPSMNLGQAVAVCCYELGKRKRAAARSDGESASVAARGATLSPPATIQSLEHVFGRAVRVLDGAGYLKPNSREAVIVRLRRMFMERGFSSHDAKILGGILAQIEWKMGKTATSSAGIPQES
ncbi:MAG: RNA methyltransferase [Terriglobia bacterium]